MSQELGFTSAIARAKVAGHLDRVMKQSLQRTSSLLAKNPYLQDTATLTPPPGTTAPRPVTGMEPSAAEQTTPDTITHPANENASEAVPTVASDDGQAGERRILRASNSGTFRRPGHADVPLRPVTMLSAVSEGPAAAAEEDEEVANPANPSGQVLHQGWATKVGGKARLPSSSPLLLWSPPSPLKLSPL